MNLSVKKRWTLVLTLAVCGSLLVLVFSTQKQIPTHALLAGEKVVSVTRTRGAVQIRKGMERAGPSQELSLTGRAKSILLEWDAQDDADLRDERVEQLENLLRGANVFQVMQDLPPQLVDYVFVLPLAREQMMADPVAAAEWMRAHTNIAEPHLQTLVHDWVLQDRTGLAQYVAALPDGEWKENFLAAAGSDALAEDPVEAVSWARLMAPGENRFSLLQMAATDWARRDPAAAERWLEQISDGSLREQLAGSLAVGYAFQNPAQAADWVVQSLPPGKVFDHAVMEIVGLWAEREPAVARDWVDGLPAGPLRTEAVKSFTAISTEMTDENQQVHQ